MSALDKNYFQQKLALISRDLSHYTPQEMARELVRLAKVADEAEASKEAAQRAASQPEAIESTILNQGEGEGKDAGVALTKGDSERDAALLNFLDNNRRLEVGLDWESSDGDWCVWKVTGSPNDREWVEVGRGDSARAAMIAAMAAQAKESSNG